MSTATPKDLFFDQLRDLYSMERQLLASLPSLAERAAYPPLGSILSKHAEETRQHLRIVTQIMERHGKTPGDDECKAIKGLIQGGDQHLDAVKNGPTRDLMLVAHCSRIEHYECAAYGITIRLANRLQLSAEAESLGSILAEEELALKQILSQEPDLFDIANGSEIA